MIRHGRSFCVAVTALLLMAGTASAQKLAIMPTYNASILPIGDQMSQFLTVELFRSFWTAGKDSVLVNPGGVYLPEDNDLIVAEAAPLHASFALVTKLLPVVKLPKDKETISLHAWLVSIPDGAITELGTYSKTVHDDELAVEYGHNGFWGTTGSRLFFKQKAGKIAGKMIDDIGAAANPYLTKIATLASLEGHGAPCDGSFRIVYPHNKIAKSYDLLLDDELESVVTDDGITNFQRASGPHLALLHMNDPPYKVPLQGWYAVNFPIECPNDVDFAFTIGPGGDGKLTRLRQ
jgi:hypothetical protein